MMSLEEILHLDCHTTAVIKLDERVNELSHHGKNLSGLTGPEKVLLLVGNLEREVNNGGFLQFYWNSSGDHAHETYDAIRTIGAKKMAEILQRANTIWPDHAVPKDRIKRQQVLETMQEQMETVWDQCDTDFYKYPEDIARLIIEYVKHNESDFQ